MKNNELNMNTSVQTVETRAQAVATREQPMEVKSQIIDPALLLLDCTALGPFLVDLPAGARKGMRSEQKGMDEVIAEIIHNQSTFAERAGVSESDMNQFVTLNERIDTLDEHLIRARTIVELLIESRAKLEDDRQRMISAIAQTVETRAKAFKDDLLLARYEKTRVYRSATGVKAARTRRRNAEQIEVDAVYDPGVPSA